MPSGITAPFWHPAFSEGFILDWDGVLAETRLNFAPLRAKYFDGKFVPLFEAVETLPPPLGDHLRKDIYDVEMAGAEAAVAVEGARELIEWLEGEDIPWCVVSRNCMESITLAAEKAGLALPPVVRSRDEPPVKPAPEALWSAAVQIGVPSKKCVMVGDFVYDLVGARRAGMRAVLVQRPEAEWKHWADVSFDRLFAVCRIPQKSPGPGSVGICLSRLRERRKQPSFRTGKRGGAFIENSGRSSPAHSCPK
jgi:haloacid dehalogenase superfamily, subfamily IA, variant 1 with third motif having Dx(3-4)D or Dx(3-4)E